MLFYDLLSQCRPTPAKSTIIAAQLQPAITRYHCMMPSSAFATCLDEVKYDSGASAGEYAKMMSYGSRWGGAIEMAACTRLFNVNVHVYSRTSRGYTRISTCAFASQNPKTAGNWTSAIPGAELCDVSGCRSQQHGKRSSSSLSAYA